MVTRTNSLPAVPGSNEPRGAAGASGGEPTRTFTMAELDQLIGSRVQAALAAVKAKPPQEQEAPLPTVAQAAEMVEMDVQAGKLVAGVKTQDGYYVHPLAFHNPRLQAAGTP